MKVSRTAIIAMLAIAALAPLDSAAQNLLLNGSFEAGLANWTSSGGACSPSTQSAGNLSTGAGGAGIPPPPPQFTAPTPASGTFVYMGDTNVPGPCTLSQDVVLPAGPSVYTLSYFAGYNYRPFGAPVGCSVSVAITDTLNVPIATGYTVVDSAVSEPMLPRTLSFSAAPGSTVRVLITETSCLGGPVGIVGDAFVLAAGTSATQVPTLSDWAKVLMALVLAGAAVVEIRRRARA